MRTRKNRAEAGLSLIELSAASVVVAVSLLGTTAAVISGASLSDEVTRMRTAARAATGIIEEIRATDFAVLAATYDGQSIPVGEHESGIDDGVAHVTVTQIDNGSPTQVLYEVAVEITFEGATGQQSYPIVTYVSDRVAGNALFNAPEVPPGTVEQQPLQEPL